MKRTTVGPLTPAREASAATVSKPASMALVVNARATFCSAGVISRRGGLDALGDRGMAGAGGHE